MVAMVAMVNTLAPQDSMGFHHVPPASGGP